MALRTILLLALLALAAQAGGAAATGEAPDKLAPIVPGQVKLTGWLGQRVEANWKNRLLTVNLEERLKPFRSPTEKDGWSGEHIGKWLHASALMWSYSGDDALRKRMDEAVASLAASQAPDGYLGTYGPQWHWGGWDVWTHKYNLLGLLADYEATRDERALAAARKIGDLLAGAFGDGKRDIIKSGTHVGMAATSVLEPVVLLYRTTRDPKYLELARYIVRACDQPNGPKIVATLTRTHSVAATANRKAYEMTSNLVGLCELYRSTGDETYLAPCRFAHDDIVANQMYITGGTSLGEHFQDPHRLPNTGAVSENCAQVTWMQLAIQLVRLTGEAKYADTVETIVYNHLLASQKPSGEALCYFTPLVGQKGYGAGTNCCTSSGPRGIALITTIAYTLAPDALAVNLYEPSTLDAQVGGTKVKLAQRTTYPVGGTVDIAVDPEKPAKFGLMLRIPSWCRKYSATLNDKAVEGSAAGGQYLKMAREWKAGDRVHVEFDMPATLVQGTDTNEGLVAVRRGPLVLAFDARLNPALSGANVSPVAEADGTVSLAVAADPDGAAAHALKGEAWAAAEDGTHKKVPLLLTSFAEAGRTGSRFAVWMPSKDRLKTVATSPFTAAKESWSREGNLSAGIADGDASTWRVTFNGQKRDEDWFAVERAEPTTINTIVYAHGHVYHDGGWWDASKGKPRLQIKKTPDGAWEDAAAIDAYPDTTAADPKGLADGKSFTVHIKPVKVVGIRVIGAAACGDNPSQNFTSCAELEGLMEKEK
jgi:hypothetical protein